MSLPRIWMQIEDVLARAKKGGPSWLLILSLFFCLSYQQLFSQLHCTGLASCPSEPLLLHQPHGWIWLHLSHTNTLQDLSFLVVQLTLSWNKAFLIKCSSFCGNTGTHCTWCMDWKTAPAQQAGREHEHCCVIHTVLSFLQLCSARGSQKASKITRIKLFPDNTIKITTRLYSCLCVEF